MVDEGQSLGNVMLLPWYFILMKIWLRKNWRNTAKKQGIGLHSVNEVETMGTRDLHALSVWLGEWNVLRIWNAIISKCSDRKFIDINAFADIYTGY